MDFVRNSCEITGRLSAAVVPSTVDSGRLPAPYSIKYSRRSRQEMESCRHRLGRALPRSLEKGLEESPMELVMVKQKFWMPLNSEKEPLRG